MGSAFVFLEASLELVPEEIRNHPAVRADARRRGKSPARILLDDSKHHSAMKSLKFREKRGRPDIIHQCLLLLLDSPMKDFEVYVHTINGELIWINRKTRLPRNYNRFVGLMEKLFVERKIVVETTLMEFVDANLRDIVKNKEVLLFREKGETIDFGEMIENDVAICIGAFPHGDFCGETLSELGNFKEISLGTESYTSLYVTSRVLCEYERVRSHKDR
ncbi:16S rRNA methyltransferase [Archaeoglobus sp.]